MNLPELREQIDAIDLEWVSLLSRRIATAKQIALMKKKIKRPIFDEEREKAMKERLLRRAQELEINPLFVKQVFNFLLVYTKLEMLNACEEEE